MRQACGDACQQCQLRELESFNWDIDLAADPLCPGRLRPHGLRKTG